MAAVTCPHCTKSVNVPDGMGGKQMRCPGCRKVFPIPGDKAAVAASSSAPIKLAAAPAGAKAGVVKPGLDIGRAYTLQFVNKGVGRELRRP